MPTVGIGALKSMRRPLHPGPHRDYVTGGVTQWGREGVTQCYPHVLPPARWHISTKCMDPLPRVLPAQGVTRIGNGHLPGVSLFELP